MEIRWKSAVFAAKEQWESSYRSDVLRPYTCTQHRSEEKPTKRWLKCICRVFHLDSLSRIPTVARDASRCTRAGRVFVVINANFLIRISVGNSINVKRVLLRECRGSVAMRKTDDNAGEREARRKNEEDNNIRLTGGEHGRWMKKISRISLWQRRNTVRAALTRVIISGTYIST